MGVSAKVTYVKVLIGHESFALEKPTPNNHRFRWILFVRPIIGSKFTDRTFLYKVEVELHPTFANPFRVLKEPPFELEETGYASFTPKLTIYFNTPHSKPYPVQYDMNLKLEKHAFHQQEMTFAMSDVVPSFLDLVRRFCGSTDGKRKKRETESTSSRNKKSKPEDRKQQKTAYFSVLFLDSTDKKLVHLQETSPSLSSMDNSVVRHTITPQRPVKVAPNKAEDRSQDSSSDSSTVYDSSPLSSSSSDASSPHSRRVLPLPELHRRLTTLTDENVIFRVAEILLTHPTATTSLLISKPSISFDLTSADNSLVLKLSQALMS
ncbi:YEATS family protein [Dictyocaulus viviparus]|uniref:YEATS family protein n=1 Tax=Dictyocaulus viviparus TaxID=29172 RepID=A0A0D8Y2H0_DICVI|nr:YEATS family protein [Dictyocaulus viviparus]